MKYSKNRKYRDVEVIKETTVSKKSVSNKSLIKGIKDFFKRVKK